MKKINSIPAKTSTMGHTPPRNPLQPSPAVSPQTPLGRGTWGSLGLKKGNGEQHGDRVSEQRAEQPCGENFLTAAK